MFANVDQLIQNNETRRDAVAILEAAVGAVLVESAVRERLSIDSNGFARVL